MGSLNAAQTNKKKGGTLTRISTGEKITYNPDPERSKPVVTLPMVEKEERTFPLAEKTKTQLSFGVNPLVERMVQDTAQQKTVGQGGAGQSSGANKTLGELLTTPAKSGFFEGVSVLGDGTLKGFGKDFAYGSERAVSALLGVGENITDFIGSGFYKGLQGVTSLGGKAKNPVSEWAGQQADAFLDNSKTRDYEQSIRERYNPSQGAENLTGIGQSVVQMLPAIATGNIAAKAISSGVNAINAPLAADIGSKVSQAVFGLQSAGSGANEAKQEGASTTQALAYGAASGLLETSIENIAGGIPGMGQGKIREIAEALKASPIVGKALDIAGEGGEEALSTIISPYLKRAIYDPDAATATGKEIAESAIMGAVAAGVLQAGIELPGAVSNAKSQVEQARAQIGSNADIMDRVNQRLNTPGQVQSDFVTLPTAGKQYNNVTLLPGAQTQQQMQTMPGSGIGTDAQNKTASTGETESGLIPITEENAASLSSGKNNIIARKASDIISFVQNALRKKGGPERLYMGTIPDTAASAIMDATGMDVAGYTAILPGDSVQHIFKNHGSVMTEESRGQKAVTAEDVALIPQVISAPDSVSLSSDTDALGRPVLLISKQIGDTYVTAQAVTDGRHALTTNSLWIKKGKGPAPIPDTGTKTGPVDNARSALMSSSSITPIIADSSAGVNNRSAQEGGTVYGDQGGSVGAAAKGFDPWSAFQGTKSEFFPEGANAARPVDVPTTDADGNPIRKTASTAMGAKAIPDDVVGDIQNMVMAGQLSYSKATDSAAIERAQKTITDNGYERALESFSSQVKRGVVSKDMATLGQQLLINAANAGDGKGAAGLLSLYAQMETAAGQAVQAASILRKLDPSYQLYGVQRSVNGLQEELSKKYKDLELTIDPALIEEFNQQTDQDGRDAVMEKIYQNVADQVPSTWKDKWNAWRYLAMLANPRTHVRNMAGNLAFQPLRVVKDRVAAAVEGAVSRATGGQIERTKSFGYDPNLYKAAWSDWANVKDSLTGSKYDDVKSEIESRKKVFKLPVLEKARTGNSWLLEIEDALFKRVTYADALAGYLNANGVNAEALKSGQVDPALMSRARDYAGREAMRATFNDRNALSDRVVQAANAFGPLGDAVLPFKRTPANVLARGLEYSPLGLLKSLSPFKVWKFEGDLYKVRNGEMTPAQAIDGIASGLTGSGLMALGAWLFAKGIVTSGGGDDEKQDAINDLTGGQNYALNLPGGGSVTLDWLAPSALPFFMGVELADSMGQGGSTAEAIMEALKSVSDPMLELSMLQSLNDMIDSVSYSENKLGALAQSAVISYFTQAVPTVLGQAERTGEDKRMTTYTDKNKTLPTDIQYAFGKVSARLPGWDYQQIPYIDAWGREEKTGTLPIRATNNFLNPAYTSSMNVTPVDAEIQRVYSATGEGSVVPSRASKDITIDGEKKYLTADEYVKYATQLGQEKFSLMEQAVGSTDYKGLSDAQKVEFIGDVYDYARSVTEKEQFGKEMSDWMEEAKANDNVLGAIRDRVLYGGETNNQAVIAKTKTAVEDIGLTVEQYQAMRPGMDTDGNNSISQKEAKAYLDSQNFTREQKAQLWTLINSKWKNNPYD